QVKMRGINFAVSRSHHGVTGAATESGVTDVGDTALEAHAVVGLQWPCVGPVLQVTVVSLSGGPGSGAGGGTESESSTGSQVTLELMCLVSSWLHQSLLPRAQELDLAPLGKSRLSGREP
ncbi:hypothetical protein NDU88_001247, partial [Pleurodeles waltl]